MADIQQEVDPLDVAPTCGPEFGAPATPDVHATPARGNGAGVPGSDCPLCVLVDVGLPFAGGARQARVMRVGATAAGGARLRVYGNGRLLAAADVSGPGAELPFTLPPATETLVTVLLAGDRCRHGSWTLPGSLESVVDIANAADIRGDVVVEGAAGPALKLRHAATIWGKVVVRAKEPDSRWWALPPGPADTTGEQSGPSWLFETAWNSLLLAAGDTLVAGREGPDIVLSCRDAMGPLAFDKLGRRIHLAAAGAKPSASTLYPLSRRHCTLRWPGEGYIDVLDGTSDGGSRRRSRRGVCAGGLRVEEGWRRSGLPVRVDLLGNKDGTIRLGLDVARVTDGVGGGSLAIRQMGGDDRAVVVWQRPGTVFGLVASEQGAWLPCGPSAICAVRLAHSPAGWSLLGDAAAESRRLACGDVLGGGNGPLRVARCAASLIELHRHDHA